MGILSVRALWLVLISFFPSVFLSGEPFLLSVFLCHALYFAFSVVLPVFQCLSLALWYSVVSFSIVLSLPMSVLVFDLLPLGIQLSYTSEEPGH